VVYLCCIWRPFQDDLVVSKSTRRFLGAAICCLSSSAAKLSELKYLPRSHILTQLRDPSSLQLRVYARCEQNDRP
jgi:hypothetical protein